MLRRWRRTEPADSREFRKQKAIKIRSAEGRPAPREVRERVAARLLARAGNTPPAPAPPAVRIPGRCPTCGR